MARSTDDAVEPGRATWRKSSKCTAGTCVEVLELAGRALIRDSKQNGLADQPIIALSSESWAGFLRTARTGEPSYVDGRVKLARITVDQIELREFDSGSMLRWDDDEWEDFCAGVVADEFGTPAPIT